MLGGTLVLGCSGGGGGNDDDTATAASTEGPGTATDAATTTPTTSEGTGVDPTEGAPADCEGPLDPGPAPLRRLTHTQYNNTVRDLFPGVTLPPQTISIDPKVNGFENNADVQTLGPAHRAVPARRAGGHRGRVGHARGLPSVCGRRRRGAAAMRSHLHPRLRRAPSGGP
ncbi:DUF1587 domain-containing protein [Nannocystis pusilla]|uniref:DUF1587 domain-containing protein n=1 Tax=Nannocystis pusilla TaxID=889268 RepID=UPI003B7A9BAF